MSDQSGDGAVVEIEAHQLGGGSELFTLSAGEERDFTTSTTRFVVRGLREEEQGHCIANQPLVRVDGRYAPAEDHPDQEVAVHKGELYRPGDCDLSENDD